VSREAIDVCVPVALREHLSHGGGEAEHRVASVGFVKFLGVDDMLAEQGPDATAEALSDIVTSVQQAIEPESVTFLASDIDANGGKIILVTGVPRARDDDEGRTLRAARSILDRRYALDVKIGVNQGHVFAGEVGAEFRRTFTIMGDTVNLAARLMAAATPGALYATSGVLALSRTVFATEMLEPFYVKGKSEPVQAYSVGAPIGVQAAEDASLPFTGRDEELQQLVDAFGSAMAGQGQVVVVTADRGAGKSRLLAEFVTATGATVMSVQGESYGTASSYLAVRSPLRAALGIDAIDPVRAGEQFLAAVKQRAPEVAHLAPLLAPVLDVEVEETDASTAIAREYRRDRGADVLIALLDAQEGSLALVVDDAHWIDDASAALLDKLFTAARARAWLGVALRRPAETGFRPRADVEIALAPIDDGLARDLIDSVTEGAPLRPQDRDLLIARAAGNPLFMEELLRHGRRSGFDQLPETLDAVATREIDVLPPAVRRVVRYASVLGRSFDPGLLAELLGDESDEASLDAAASFLVWNGERLQFRHALLQEAAYETLPFRTRIELHGRAAEAILKRPSVDHDADEAALSLHFFLAQQWERAYKSARQAGLRALVTPAPGEAATHLERAVSAARRLEDVSELEIAELLIELGEAYVTLGLYDRGEDWFRRAAPAFADNPVELARLYQRRGYVRGEYQGRFGVAVRHVRAGLSRLAAMDDPGIESARVRAQLLAHEALFRQKQGKLSQSMRLCEATIAEAEPVGELRALAIACGVLDMCLAEMGRFDEATHMGRALELYEILGDQLKVAATLGNLGGVSFFQSEWVQAGDYYARAAVAATKAGDLATAALANGNLGEVLVNQGRLQEAEALLGPAVRTLESFENLTFAGSVGLHLARARAFLGDYDGGATMLRGIAFVSDVAHMLVISVDARARLAEISVHAGALGVAADAIAEARELEVPLGETPFTAGLDRVEVTLAVTAGDLDRAQALLPDAIARSRRTGSDYDLLLLLTIAEHIGLGDGERECRALREQLGVERLAPLEHLV
jgi:class 3 adenylate cyclase/tetratricopeptide (TPR) repeat protein